jgi:transketolase
MTNQALDELCIQTIRFLAVDAVEKAKSGHPGMPMGAAGLAYTLWDRHLKHNPADPQWIDRDRFVLSAGHASMLLYALLYLTGYGLTLEDIKSFRQWGSLTPGHPEFGLTPGVEATTGPLGQGFANGVGMAIAERWLAARFNRPGYEIFNHHTYALVSDGDLQEGVASEAASLAGTLKLGKIIYLYDSNDVQQDGPVVSFRENVIGRFQAYGWNVIGPINGMEVAAVDSAIRQARSNQERPNLIICKTVIGFGSPHKAGTNAAHGEPLGEEEVRLTREKSGWEYSEPFKVPEEALEHFRKAIDRGQRRQSQWQEMLRNYAKEYPREARQMKDEQEGVLPEDWGEGLESVLSDFRGSASTRDVSGAILRFVAGRIPCLMGGAADLAGSTRAYLKGYDDFMPDSYEGRNIRYGLREHAMGSISNGLALHGGVIPFAATFLIFSDYMRPAIRLAALMKLKVIYIFSHDSIGLGEDGPTHQPVEQLNSLRMIPDLLVVRPADVAETLEAWKIALERREGPTALILTRQKVAVLDRSVLSPASGVRRGGYILWESGENPRVILIGTGSEVQVALEAGRRLQEKGLAVRVVSLPSWSLFDAQPVEYRDQVLPPQITARVAVEAGTPVGWERYTGLQGAVIGISQFGHSAPGGIVLEKMGITPQRVVQEALKLIQPGVQAPLVESDESD